ncbi:hypothetical protein QZH41_012403, partial [Actinostola sp. cb2023]
YTGHNVIGRLNGRYSNTKDDRVLIIGAHYDTYQTSPGVDDNGSGLAALLQVARQYTSQDCQRNFTIMFVAFDMKECQQCRFSDHYRCICSFGSRNFIKNFTQHIGTNKTRGQLQGAVILDSIMNFDWRANKQSFPYEIKTLLDQSVRQTVDKIERSGNRGNFVLAVGRNNGDGYLLGNFTKYYTENKQHEGDFFVRTFKFTLQQRPTELSKSAQYNYRHLFKGDHYRFWDNDPIVNAIYLTDTADFRGYMKYCYHNDCDVMSEATPLRIQFMAKTADTVEMMARKLTGLRDCVKPSGDVRNKVLTSTSGYFHSHGYPRRYHNNADSTWIITVAYGHVIELWFTDFILEYSACRSDYVDVFDGWSSDSKRLDLKAAIALRNVQSIQYFLEKFNVSRNSEFGRSTKEKARDLIKNKLEEQGYGTWLEYFNINGNTGYNVVARKSGQHTKNINDRILIIGAHYDTYETSPGVDDNGSGLAAMLQVARQYSDRDQDCDQNFTIVFVAFDQKDCKTCNYDDSYKCICSYGSQAFIKNFTKNLGQNSEYGKIQGAVILESIMNFDQSLKSQNISDELRDLVDQSVRTTVADIEKDGSRGDYLLAIGRIYGDDYLIANFTKYFYQGEHYTAKFKLRKFRWNLQQRPTELSASAQYNYRHLFKGDHYRFWDNNPIVNAIYLTDTADFRGYMKYCYHNDCDDFSHVTTERLEFMANTANTIYMMAQNMTGRGQCEATLLGNISQSYYGTSGEFTSPGYTDPKHYPNNADSTWYITVPSGYRVELEFTDFELEKSECTNDYVNVYNGFESDARLLGHYCGTSPPKNGVRSTSRYMRVLFRSDYYDTYRGFKAKWTAQGRAGTGVMYITKEYLIGPFVDNINASLYMDIKDWQS